MVVAMSMTGDELRNRLADLELTQEVKLRPVLPISTCWMLVFGIEVGIKALLQDKEDLKVPKIHKLDCLWKKLSPSVQEAVKDRVAAYCTAFNLDVPYVDGLLE